MSTCNFRGAPASDISVTSLFAQGAAVCQLQSGLEVVPPLEGTGAPGNPLTLAPCAIPGEFYVWNGTSHVCAPISAVSPLVAQWTGLDWLLSEDSCSVYRVPIAYATIQLAIDAINAAAPGPSHILLCPGTYVESFTLPTNTQLTSTAQTSAQVGGVSNVRILGTITIPAAPGGRWAFAGLDVSGVTGPALDASASSSGSIQMAYCQFSGSSTAVAIELAGGTFFATFCGARILGVATQPALRASAQANLETFGCDWTRTTAGGGTSMQLNDNAVYRGNYDTFFQSTLELNDAARCELLGVQWRGTSNLPLLVDNNTSIFSVRQ